MVVAIGLIVALAVGLFRGSFSEKAMVTVISPRAGLVMDPDAKVRLHGAEVGRVASIEALADGQSELRLAMDPAQLHLIPSNVHADITSSTVFGAKYVELLPPPQASPENLRAGQVLTGQQVTVEINTVFQQLTDLLGKIDPAKLNETLSALSMAFSGRGAQLGQTISDADELLATIEPTLPALSHELETLPPVSAAYADAAPNLVTLADNASRISSTIFAEKSQLDAALVSVIGLADTGIDVLGTNRQPITDLLRLLVPTTDLANQYHEGLNCALEGMRPIAFGPPLPVPGVITSSSFMLGTERYRYPKDLPKVAATGGPHCGDVGLPRVGFNQSPPYLVADTGANPWQYGNQGILLDSDGLKQALFGPIDGPPRNSAQIGQPG
jgi:virulence factor Mce-like protein